MSLLKELLLFSVAIFGGIRAQNNNNNVFYDGAVCIAAAPVFGSVSADNGDGDAYDEYYEEPIYSTTDEPDYSSTEEAISSARARALFLGRSSNLDDVCMIQWEIKQVIDAPACDGELCFALKNTELDTNNIYLNNGLFLSDRISASSMELWFIEPHSNGQVNILSVAPDRDGNTLLCRRVLNDRLFLRKDNAVTRRLCQWALQKPTKGGLGMIGSTAAKLKRSGSAQSKFKFNAILSYDPNARRNKVHLRVFDNSAGTGFPNIVHFTSELIFFGQHPRRALSLQSDIECIFNPFTLVGGSDEFQVSVSSGTLQLAIGARPRIICTMLGSVDSSYFIGASIGRWTGFAA